MATIPTRSAAAQQVTVHLGTRKLDNVDAVHKIVLSTLGRLGCGGCFSGFDIRFSHIPDLVVNPKTFEVGEQQFGG